MKKLMLVMITTILVIVSFFLGRYFSTYQLAEKTVASIQELTNFALNNAHETDRLIMFYETSINDPDQVSNHIKWSILVNYDSGRLCSGYYCAQMNVNYPSHETNRLIIEFLKEHTDESCRELTGKALVECNLELLP